MRIDKVHIKSQFKNLSDFHIDIDENAWETVLLGLNATGKSNFLEALVIIFRDIDLIYNLGKNTEHQKEKLKLNPFSYYIKYECRNRIIEINLNSSKYTFKVNGEKSKDFIKNIEEYLPKHVFIYYSGISDRLTGLYKHHLKEYYNRIISKSATREQFDTMRRIFLAENIHANFALIAFYMFKDQEEETIKFLSEELKIMDFGSALFTIKEPEWVSKENKNEILWGATGLVRRFLEDLLLFSYAPILHKSRIDVSYNHEETQNRLYLYFKDKASFADLVELKYKNKIELFNALESIHISKLLADVKIKVQKEDVNGELAMSELSEGEKQLLTVLGLLKFTKDEESLILLDEPDTHLNPMWKWKYLDYLDKVVKRKGNTQIIFCSHDPLVIGNLKKNQVQIFKKNSEGKTEASNPDLSPREMSVSKILTSELFGIPSLMSKKLEDLLNQKRFLQAKISKGELDKGEKTEFERLKKYFDKIGFGSDTVDSRYNRFLELTSNYKEFANRRYTKEEADELDQIAKEVLDEILKEEKGA